MRKVQISGLVIDKISNLESYLIDELKLSEEAALRRSARMRNFVQALSNAVDYPLCRFKSWRILGYRCAVCEKDWIFAYEIFEDGVIVRDMSHTSLLIEYKDSSFIILHSSFPIKPFCGICVYIGQRILNNCIFVLLISS